MSFCEKCGAYIPIGETACPACGHDPEAEARAAREAAAKAAAEEKARQAAAAAAAFRQQQEAEAEQRRAAAEAEARAARERLRQEEERRRAEEAHRWQQDPRQRQGYSGGAARSQYASERTGRTGTQYTSQRTGAQSTWTPPWQASQTNRDEAMRRQASDSAANQKLSILSYIGPLFVIPMLSRPNDDFARYHANQGLSLFLAGAAMNLACGILGLDGLTGLVSLAQLAGAVIGIRNVLRGKKDPLPLIGNWKLLK